MNDLLNDLDIFGENRRKLSILPIPQKWGFIKIQNNRDRHMQSPQFLLEQFRENPTFSVLETIVTCLCCYRLSWGKVFCQNNGYLDILAMIGGIQARIDFNSTKERDIELLLN